jgi:hypothetical protein
VCSGTGGCSIDFAGTIGHWALAPTSQLRFQVICGAPSCETNPDRGSIHVYYAAVTLDNYSAPSLTNGQGNLWTSNSWLSGVQSGSYTAADDVGIKNAIIDVDGSSSNGWAPTSGIAATTRRGSRTPTAARA